MSATQAEELVRRNESTYKRVYEGDLRAQLEATAWGKYCALDIESGGYLVAETREAALEEFRSRFPNGFPLSHTDWPAAAPGLMATIAGRLDSRRMPIVDLQILGARARITVLSDTRLEIDFPQGDVRISRD